MNSRKRLVFIVAMLKVYSAWLSVNDLMKMVEREIDEAEKIDRRAIYADLKALEEYGLILLRKKGNENRFEAKWISSNVHLQEAIKPE